MGKQIPRMKKASGSDAHDMKLEPAGAAPPDTKVTRSTATPSEDDPLWEQLGATRVSGDASDSSLNAPEVSASANFTRMSPTQVLGKDLKELGDFRLIRKLGEGAMGAVYKAEQVSFNRIVALKVLFPHVASNPKLVARLEREAEVMFQLEHPNIVQSYAYDVVDGFHCVAMEYISGQSMQKWLSQIERLPVGDAVRVTLECARALAYAHGQNMVHRDIKPDNILVTKRGTVKVADLGMVKVDDEEMSLTQTGHAVGTPWYMPLEQARNAKEIDGRSDIYALGCTLYAFLTGHPPFTGRTIVDVIQAKEMGTFPPARQSNADVPERLDLILAKMTAKLPKYRYQSCEELIKDLESLNLASPKLGFLAAQSIPNSTELEQYEAMGKTSVSTSAKARPEASPSGPVVDPNVWYVQTKLPDGGGATRKYTTAQLRKMLAEGTIKPTARVSHLEDQGFRALGTYKEFQGVALGDMAKKAADKNTSRFRNVLKEFDDDEREKEKETLERHGPAGQTTLQATRRYWIGIFLKVLPVGIGILTFLCILLYFAGFFSRS